jgi:2-polyprenyl-3-methyl-5-hydroxy-6-metoxy-1,4-benzoquinol methylase
MVDKKFERNCIVCKGEAYAEMFCFTYDFLLKVRGQTEKGLAERGWANDTTSSVVKCTTCGTNYIRDVVRRDEDREAGHTDHFLNDASKKAWADLFVSKFGVSAMPRHAEQRMILECLIKKALPNAAKNSGELRFLEFGAAKGEFSLLARSLDVRKAVAYDVSHPTNIQEIYDITHPPGTIAARKFEQVEAEGPYDMVVCQSVFEHLFEPRKELERMRSVMSKGGVLYINNPLMDLDSELTQLKSAIKIIKSDKISHYHPLHLNYLTPSRFNDLLKEVGFQPVSAFMHFENQLEQTGAIAGIARLMKDLGHYAVSSAGLTFRRQLFVAKAI